MKMKKSFPNVMFTVGTESLTLLKITDRCQAPSKLIGIKGMVQTRCQSITMKSYCFIIRTYCFILYCKASTDIFGFAFTCVVNVCKLLCVESVDFSSDTNYHSLRGDQTAELSDFGESIKSNAMS